MAPWYGPLTEIGVVLYWAAAGGNALLTSAML